MCVHFERLSVCSVQLHAESYLSKTDTRRVCRVSQLLKPVHIAATGNCRCQTFTSSAISKPTFSLILNWRHKRLCIPRRTLWRYTNVVLLLLLYILMNPTNVKLVPSHGILLRNVTSCLILAHWPRGIKT